MAIKAVLAGEKMTFRNTTRTSAIYMEICILKSQWGLLMKVAKLSEVILHFWIDMNEHLLGKIRI